MTRAWGPPESFVIVYPDNQGSPLDVYISLYEIARRDTQIGDEPVSDAVNVSQVLYTAPTDLDGFGRNLIFNLTNSSAIVYIMAVGGDFVLDDGTPISEAFGVTIPDGTILLGDDELPAIVVYYDYTNGNGEGYALFDEDGEEICLPSFVLLGHELSHAAHMIAGDHPEDPAEAHELVIIPEENQIRAEHNLPLRDPANDGGVTPSAVCASPEPGSSSCFVLTAALGMERHDPIAALHALRRRLFGPTRLGALFYAALRREYYAFAPTLADEVRGRRELRQAIRESIIEPFLGWAAAVDRYFDPRAGYDAVSFARRPAAVDALDALIRRLRTAGEPAGPADGLPNDLAAFLAARIGPDCGRAPFTTWAVFEAARLALTTSPDAPGFDETLEAWLGAMPIPDRFYTLTARAFAREMDDWSAHGLFSGAAGVALASRAAEGFRRRGLPERCAPIERASAVRAGGRSWRS